MWGDHPKEQYSAPLLEFAHIVVSNQATILVAEDSESDILLIKLGFEDAHVPYALQFVDDGMAATEYLSGQGKYEDRTKYPVPCLLLTDLKMPRMNGFELLEWVRENAPWKGMPVIVVSGSDQPQDRERA